ncbi:HIV Tat-specific factor 1 [Kwoniella heveanensis CBS 569]|nr:HIV Tat-specific factor 1 [Kwoniella heveanensis CBS 569]
MPLNAPIPGKFEEDPRVHFDKTVGKWQYEDDDGSEYEWNGQAWIPLINEELWKAQQAAYAVAGVDEKTPANAVIARDERRNKKRKKGEKDYTSNTAGTSSNGGGANTQYGNGESSHKPATAPSKKTAVWVTNLPPNATVDMIASVFQKAGVLMIDDEGEPRIKLYYDDDGKFKGEALVMYFKEGSVDLAITLLDDTELELGAGYGNMRVKVAEYDKAAAGGPNGNDKGKKKNEDAAAGTSAGEAASGGGGKHGEKKKLSAEEKQRMSKRIRTMQNKVTWHSDDDSDDPMAPAGGAPAPLSNRFNRVVVLKGMFTVEDLEKDPSLLLELKEDVRDEAETLGSVTNVVLYDKEEDGVMTIKFKDPVAAQACVMKMNNRFFDGRRIYAGIYTGKERYHKSGGTRDFGDDEEGDQEERERLDNFAQWLVEGEGENNDQ